MNNTEKNERVQKLGEIKTNVESLVKQYNEAMVKENLAEMAKVDAETLIQIGKYSEAARLLCFDELKATADPMLEAVKRLTYDVIGIKDEKIQGTESKRRVLVEGKQHSINLAQLDKHCDGIGANKEWMHMVQKLNCLFTIKVARSLGIDPTKINDSYEMTQAAREFNFEGKDPTSKTQLTKTLQTVVDAMLGEGKYKVTSHAVAFLEEAYCRKDKSPRGLVAADHNRFRQYLAEVCNHLVTGAQFTLKYKEVKDPVSGKTIVVKPEEIKPSAKTEEKKGKKSAAKTEEKAAA